MTVKELIAFEQNIAEAFNAGKIKAPVHLSGGNEQQLIDIFKDVGPNDWIGTTWRSHLHCLLRGVPPEQLKADILSGKSITLNYPSHRIISSAIVGGILPIALGIALAIKRSGGSEKVWVFIGDMTVHHGSFYECLNYAFGFDLPIEFVVEDNGLSVCTETKPTCGISETELVGWLINPWSQKKVRWYKYDLAVHYPHSGAGIRVNF